MSIELITRLRQMKLHGMASAWPELASKARQRELDPEQWFGELLTAESAEREVKSQANQMKAARFPAHRDLLGFDFAYSRVDEALVRRLHGGEFLDSAQNVVLSWASRIVSPFFSTTHVSPARSTMSCVSFSWVIQTEPRVMRNVVPRMLGSDRHPS